MVFQENIEVDVNTFVEVAREFIEELVDDFDTTERHHDIDAYSLAYGYAKAKEFSDEDCHVFASEMEFNYDDYT